MSELEAKTDETNVLLSLYEKIPCRKFQTRFLVSMFGQVIWNIAITSNQIPCLHVWTGNMEYCNYSKPDSLSPCLDR